jgi:hypothetical protein
LAVATRQHLLFTRQQVIDIGASQRQIERRLDDDRWIRRRSGLYSLPGAVSDWETNLAGACLVSRGVASQRSAAVLWGLDGLRASRPEITVPRHRRIELDGVRVHESTQCDDRSITTRGATTSITRIALCRTTRRHPLNLRRLHHTCLA